LATLSAAHPPALRILLIEDDPIDAVWITDLINEKSPRSEVVHSASVPDGLSVLAGRPFDAVFLSVHPDGAGASIQGTREIVHRAGRRSVVALVNAVEMVHVDEVRAAGVKFVYRKHPIMRTAEIRKQEVREKWEALVTEHALKCGERDPDRSGRTVAKRSGKKAAR
jgi:hypothetical protein